MKPTITILILFLCAFVTTAQKEAFELTKLTFSSSDYDEFSPVFYEEGLVYSSNKRHDALIRYRGAGNNLPLNLYFADKADSLNWRKSTLFNRHFSSVLHDGPATFTSDFEKIIYSRNIEAGVKFKNVVNPNNKLGLFLSEKQDGKWMQSIPFPYNSNDYSITTPSYAPDGTFVIFASDMPGGFGGSDLYISRKAEGGWLRPENLGVGINTHSSEAYPFISAKGDLYFSSNGYDGFGGKDLLVATRMEEGWGSPVLLKEPLNSAYDDISICTDDYLETGYISTNRDNTDDIFHFKALAYDFENCNKQKEGQYCYMFTDDNASENTTPFTKYQWEFSDGSKKDGVAVQHCFKGPGKYSVKLNLIDEVTGNMFFTKSAFDFEIEKHVQPYISTVDVSCVGENILFDSYKSHLPGISLKAYYWETGDGDLSTTATIKHKYSEAGEYKVQLGIIGEDSLGQRTEHCVHKRLSIYKDPQEIAAQKGYTKLYDKLPSKKELDSINGDKSFDPLKDAYVFGFSFANLSPDKRFELELRTSQFNYQKLSFIDSVPQENRLFMVDTLIKVMNDFPNIKLELAVHLGPSWQGKEDVKVTKSRLNGLLETLVNSGISANRIGGKAYGSSRSINLYNANKRFDVKMNNRVEFIFLQNYVESSGNRLLD